MVKMRNVISERENAMRLLRWLVGLTTAAVMGLALVVPAVQAGAATEVDLFARLHGSTAYPHGTGYSSYERSSTEREVEVAASNLPSRLYGRTLYVYANYKKVGTMKVSYTGRAHREWSTEHGQYVPYASAGDPVRVRTYYGTLVVSGWYYRVWDD